MVSGFEQAYRDKYGRIPTPADRQRFEQYDRRRFDAQYPEPPGTAEKLAIAASPLINSLGTVGGLYLANNLLGPAGAAKAATAGAVQSAATGAGAASGGLLGGGAASSALPVPQVFSGTPVAASGAASATAAAPTASGGLLGGLASYAPIAGLIGGAALAKNAYEDIMEGDSKHALINSLALGGPFGGLLGFGLSKLGLGGGKDEHQQSRDNIRDSMREYGLMDENDQVRGVNLGQDGGFRFDDGRKIYEVAAGQEDGTAEFSDEQGRAVGALNPLGWILQGGTQNRDEAGYSTGMLYNALAESGDEGVTDQEIRGLYAEAGIDQGRALGELDRLQAGGLITPEEYAAGRAAIDEFLTDAAVARTQTVRQGLFGGGV